MTKEEKDKATKMYSYEVVMTVHIVADTEKEATKQLDEKGGIVTKRNVTLLNSALLYGEKETE